MVKEDDSKKAEQELTKIRKLPENKVCANCQEPGHPLLTAVVMPFKIFVCSTCKSAHQSFSHRCKSAQMSLWTMDEVRSLEDRNGGGNRAASERWLAHVRDGDRPKEGDRLERFKDFVQRAYIEERWIGNGAGGARGGGGGGRARREESPEPPPRSARPAARERGSDRDRDPPPRRAGGSALPDLFDPDATAKPTASQPRAQGAASVDFFDYSAAPAPASQGPGVPTFDSFDPNAAGRAPQAAPAAAGGLDFFVSAGPSPGPAQQQPQPWPGMVASAPASVPAAAPFDPGAGGAFGNSDFQFDAFQSAPAPAVAAASAPTPQANFPAAQQMRLGGTSPMAPSGGCAGSGAGAAGPWAGGMSQAATAPMPNAAFAGMGQQAGPWAPMQGGGGGPSPNQRYAALGGGFAAPGAGMGAFGTPWPQGQQQQMSPFAMQQHQVGAASALQGCSTQALAGSWGGAGNQMNGFAPNSWGPGAAAANCQAPAGMTGQQANKAPAPVNIQDLQQNLQQLYAKA